VELGYTNVKVYHAGLPAWKKSKGLLLSEVGFVKGMMKKQASYVLLDVRSPRASKKGHIKSTVNIPLKTMKPDMFPKEKNAKIIIYGKGAEKAFKMVRGWGYKSASVLDGGAAKWEASKGKLFAGTTMREINYVFRLPKGEIASAEFKTAIKDESKIILDVRDTSTASGGMLPGAINIPVAELKDRISELAKDKEVLIHCNTGVLASMAYEKLSANGYKARFLNAVIQVAQDGSYEISKK
jgi:rhodanese-related sulfurtransferase